MHALNNHSIITDRHHDVKIFALFPGLFVDRDVGRRGADHLCPVCSLPLKIQDHLPGQKRISHPRLSFPRGQSGFWKKHHHQPVLLIHSLCKCGKICGASGVHRKIIQIVSDLFEHIAHIRRFKDMALLLVNHHKLHALRAKALRL